MITLKDLREMRENSAATTLPEGGCAEVAAPENEMGFIPVAVEESDLVNLPVTVPENDPVNHPSHYTQGKIECIDFISDKELNFCRGNAVKYIVRAGLKDPNKEIEDLEKAVLYLNWEIQKLKKEQEA